jgi:hypothetical protein
MAKKRTKKKQHTSQVQFINWKPSKNYLEQAERVAKKVMRILEIDPALFDNFTKKQKIALLQMEKALPSIRIAPGSAVPKAYLEYTRRRFFDTMGTHFIDNNEDVRLTYMDLITYGAAFFSAAYIHTNMFLFTGTEQKAILQQIVDRCHDTDLFSSNRCSMIDTSLISIMSGLTQAQFRVYGYNLKWASSDNRCLAIHVEIHSHAPESVHVMLRGKIHKVYKMFIGGINNKKPITATIDYQKIFPTRTNIDNRELTIYIQNHAIHRMKERLDTMLPIDRTFMLMASLVINPEIRLGTDGQPLFCCKWSDGTILGYFPFLVQDNKAIVTTFLPLASSATNEGKQLQDRLHLQMDDIKYLGMDKLRFYIYTNFDEIPELKQALIDTGFYKIVDLFERNPNITSKAIAERTQNIKKYLGY